MHVETKPLELQQALQRFATQFTDRVAQATDVVEQASERRVRDHALRRGLSYISSALEIASGPVPAIALLDMFVLIRLCRSVLIGHWSREYGNAGRELVDTFAGADSQITTLVTRTLGAEGTAKLTEIVDAWLHDNPDQTRVEGFRLSDFGDAAGEAMAAKTHDVHGLLSSMKSASRAANDALQVVERALFLVHRLPFVWRAQVRLVVREVIGDVTSQVAHVLRQPFTLIRRGARAMAALAPHRSHSRVIGKR